MALIDELKQQKAEIAERLERACADVQYFDGRMADLLLAISALEPTPLGQAGVEVETPPDHEPNAILTGDPDEQDDASEFAEEGYAPVTQAEPPAMEGVAFVDGKWTIPEPSFEEVDDDGLEHIAPADEANHPQAAYIAPTDPEADAIAKAADYYDPKAMAERNKFNPFSIFKRETEES